MWIVQKNGDIEILANNPEQYILPALKEQHPGAAYFRSKKPCINEVNALIFAVTVEDGELMEIEEPATDKNGNPILDDDGNPVVNRYEVRGPGKVISSGNKARLGDNVLVVETKEGEEIARFDLEVVS